MRWFFIYKINKKKINYFSFYKNQNLKHNYIWVPVQKKKTEVVRLIKQVFSL
jgi:hypothetical protein